MRVIELPPPPVLVREDLDITVPEHTAAGNRWIGWCSSRGMASFLSSFLFHSALILGMALWLPASDARSGRIALVVVPADDDAFISSEVLPEAAPSISAEQFAGDVVADHAFTNVQVHAPAGELPELAYRQPAAALNPLGPPADYLLRTRADVSGALAGRGRTARAEMVRLGGGTAESEDAVERGLRWIMAQQRPDGGFSFRHLRGARNPGTESSRTAATALCMLPYLGAGYTHQEGPYRDVVQRGMYYLVRSARQTQHGADLQNGTMYAQGLATIALCEAYAMTGDPALKGLAEQAMRFVLFAQDPKGGGWRYTPGEPGDTTVTGWQLMALKSAQMAGLSVPSPTLVGVRRFLDGVQSEYGANYGYMDAKPGETTTAIGLLCRMYTGWDRDHHALRRGVEDLDQWGPSKDNMYLNYYATQVLHHYGGEPWKRWNPVMRDYLVATQSDDGHEAGSWHFSGGHGNVGGRLYNTAMAVMTLQVYYRYMPLYTDHAITDTF